MSYDWHGLLTPWSTALIEAGEAEDISVPPEVAASGWLGYPGATEAQLAAAEARLGTRLPPSYRQFLSVTNGWRQTGSFVYRLWSTEEIAWFRVRHQGWIDAYTGPHDGDREPLPDEEYFVYGEAQDPVKFRAEHLRTALEISDRGDAAIYLLNPQIVTPEGEWEAWFFANWLPGARRYRSFWELMQGEYRSFRRLRAHDAKRMRKQDALTQLPGKLPGLIDELLQKAQFYRWASTKQGGLHRAYDEGIAQELESVAEQVRQLQAQGLEPGTLLAGLRALAQTTEHEYQQTQMALRDSPLYSNPLGMERAKAVGLGTALGILGWFLRDAPAV